MIALPLVWFITPLITTLKAVVRSPTALTRRKTVVIKMQMPREAFFELVSTMKEGDAEGLLRDAETGDPLPTNRGTAHATVNRWKYSVEKERPHIARYPPCTSKVIAAARGGV